MDWLLYAILAPLFFSIGNIVDKVVLSKYIKNPKSYFYFGNLFFIVYLLFFLKTGLNNIPIRLILLGLLGGIVHFGAIYSYNHAMSKEDVSKIVIMVQLIPVVTLVLSWLFLNETLSRTQLIAFIIMFIGSMLISINKNFEMSKAIKEVLLVVLFIAINNIIMKHVYGYIDLIQGMLLYAIGHFVVVIPLYFDKKGRRTFIKEFTQLDKKILLIIVLSGFLALAGVLSFYQAISIGSVSLVSIIGAFSPMFVFIFTIFLSKYFPKILKEDLSKPVIIRKVIAIFIIFIGFFLLTR